MTESIPDQVEYRPIDNYPGYRVGSDGSVWTCKKKITGNGKYILATTWHRMRGRKIKDYPRVTLSHDGQKTDIFIHLLVLRAFIGPCPTGMEACHANDIKTDNRVVNLRWDTPQNNWIDRKQNGHDGSQWGETSHFARLTNVEVADLRTLAAQGISWAILAERYNIQMRYVRLIVTRKARLHG